MKRMMINSNQNMEESHIINEWNDGEDNDLESLGEDHSSLTLKKIWQSEYK